MKTVAELNALREQCLASIALRGDEALASVKADYKRNVLVCGGTGCTSSNSLKIVEALKREKEEAAAELAKEEAEAETETETETAPATVEE